MAIVYGTNNSETINALDGVTSGADTIYGYGGNDIISGLGGNDLIVGGAGADQIDGGSGIDTAYYTDSMTGVFVSLTTGLGSGGTAEGDTLTGVENLYGSSHDDTLAGDSGNNSLSGMDGVDMLKGGGGADILSGGNDNDTLLGGAGADTLYGGEGSDTADYAGSSVGVTVSLLVNQGYGGDAEGDTYNSIERISGSSHADTFHGNNDVNFMRGMGGNDTLKGYGGKDYLHGDDGDDVIFGMEDKDSLYGEDGNDTLYGGSGNDWLQGDGGNDTLYGGEGFDYLKGGDDDDILYSGTLGADMYGEDGNDTLYGSDGINVMYGGMGRDSLTGGGGDWDHFVWHDIAETGVTQATADVITDFSFSGDDRLNLGGIDADVYAAGDQAFVFIGNAAFSGTPGEIRYYHSGGNTFLEMQTGTSPDVEGVIQLSGIHTPEASWFLL